MSDSDYNLFYDYYKRSANQLLSMTLPVSNTFSRSIDAFYNIILGAGIVNSHIPLVKFDQDDSIIDPNYIELMYKDISSGTRDFLKPTSQQPPTVATIMKQIC
jgi:hypothetical protein